ncbi:MAG: 16S rRNA (cytosine(967)-C(5))-methyltransferase RsmB [Gammaproteobacteria bacterium]|nr:MAG: 16S rRNA (cytosine(967)-C(5))-methyltransferase RsmB [Gammaproteobacteria bacterium]
MENSSPSQKNPAKKKKNRPPKAKVSAARAASLITLKQVFHGQSLSAVQVHTTDKLEDARDRGLANEIVNGVLRWRWQLEFFISRLLKKPLKQKDFDVQLILLMALYELNECRTPDYAVINESVELVRHPGKNMAGKKWAAGLVNAVLRSFTREKEKLHLLVADDAVCFSHPAWILDKIKNDWPQHWQQILDANNQRPAFCLRVNQLQYSVSQYQQLLVKEGLESSTVSLADHALKLSHGIDVRLLPGFTEGSVSVQDAGAQLVAGLLNVSETDRVLDLCAAPGGKTCHILERYQSVDRLLAVELDAQRILRVSENLQRLKLGSRAELIVADARDTKHWWDGDKFDRILIDAPCSASGVIRRHPDIKTLRRESDIAPLAKLQSEILNSAWQMLEAGGELLYVTCSIFNDENQNQIQNFLSVNDDAVEIKINADWGMACEYGRQLFPGEQDADGFYYCRLKKVG